jgi:pyruvate/oxaloacetate carboxyltransferase
MGANYLFQILKDSAHALIYSFTVNLPFLGDLGGVTVDATARFFTEDPYSRSLEAEADLIGMYLMAMVRVL